MKFIVAICLFFAFVPHIYGEESKGNNWSVSTTSRDNYNGVTLANGRIGLVSGTDLFSVSEIVLNGVYDKEYAGGVSRIVRAPNFTNLSLKIDGAEVSADNIKDWKQTLHMKEAYLKTSFLFHGVHIAYTLRALRNLPYMAMGVVEITPDKDILIEAANKTTFYDEQQNGSCHFKRMRDLEARMPIFVSEAESCTGLQQLATCTAFLFDDANPNNEDVRQVRGDNHSLSFTKKIGKGQTYRFALVGAACSSRNFVDPKNEAERMAVFALRHNLDSLIAGHLAAWEKLWESDIVIEGNDEDQKDVRLALYNLYSFQRKGSRLSISPMGLSSSTGYNGHVFWDSEIWMYPPVLLLNQDLAKAHIDYRLDRLGKALQRSEMFGYEGAMYPWESDDSGEESTPTWCLTGTFEHHITADIGIAFWNYYRVSKDKEWLRNEGYRVIREVANFWASRAVRNADGTYSIKNVVGANEYASNVDDNAFTNGSAKVALMNAVKAAKVLNLTPDKKWSQVASNLSFHFMKDGTMKEHANYKGEMIKQADVNLLAYPLKLVVDRDSVLRDMNYYKDKMDKVNGPAMGNAILSIISARLGNIQEAYQFFKMSYMPNKRPPFGVLSESAASNNPYFATGAGGLLQAVLFGFGGLDLTDEGIKQQKPILPEEWKSLIIKGVGPDKKTFIIKH